MLEGGRPEMRLQQTKAVCTSEPGKGFLSLFLNFIMNIFKHTEKLKGKQSEAP